MPFGFVGWSQASITAVLLTLSILTGSWPTGLAEPVCTITFGLVPHPPDVQAWTVTA